MKCRKEEVKEDARNGTVEPFKGHTIFVKKIQLYEPKEKLCQVVENFEIKSMKHYTNKLTFYYIIV